MAYQPTFGDDPAQPSWPTSHDSVENGGGLPAASVNEFDLAELKAKFNSYGGGVTPEMSANLALEIVLNAVVEQACLATGASGAAIALERDGEWICRASAGSNAPHLGAKLDAETGLSGACVRTREVQRCDDAQNDARVDAEACRQLGVRSVIVFPLLLSGELVGVLELFSRSCSAFGERDERTLEALSQGVLKTLEQTYDPEPTPEAAEESAPPIIHTPPTEMTTEMSMTDISLDENESPQSEPEYFLPVTMFPQAGSDEFAPGRGVQFLTWSLGAAVLASAIFLTVIFAQHLVGRKASRHTAPVPGFSAAALRGSGTAINKAAETTSPGSVSDARGVPPAAAGSMEKTPTTPVPQPKEPALPAGGLLVYENGKEIFRIPPAEQPRDSDKTASSGRDESTDSTANQPASIIERAGIYEVSPEVAAASLLHRVEPDYPEEARSRQIQGPVVLQVRAAGDGSVQQVDLVSGQPLLANAAIAAVKQWRFKPHMVQGQPAAMQMKVTLNFKLPATASASQ